ncbi:hypothetical protein STVIR_3535 [Streptomyces viridochromogenes Tue57]|uniref:Uncharacterized protein n=1 Tax=Streptomyces viridochromogenes Tue57 TaxID=1160705 RepID=L8PHJ1_STRVR|nr:hypothetical protein STVIR_3535 [Streptomyces viridochromogenes Tue57]
MGRLGLAVGHRAPETQGCGDCAGGVRRARKITQSESSLGWRPGAGAQERNSRTGVVRPKSAERQSHPAVPQWPARRLSGHPIGPRRVPRNGFG